MCISTELQSQLDAFTSVTTQYGWASTFYPGKEGKAHWVELGTAIFNALCHSDEQSRLAGAHDDAPYDVAVRAWLNAAEAILPHLEDGDEVTDEQSSRFKACVLEARGILTPDDQFFTGDALAELRDQAIDEHRAGQTEPM